MKPFEGKSPYSQGEVLENNHLENTPIIPSEVYENLPQFLKEGSEVFLKNRSCLPILEKGIWRVEVSW